MSEKTNDETRWRSDGKRLKVLEDVDAHGSDAGLTLDGLQNVARKLLRLGRLEDPVWVGLPQRADDLDRLVTRLDATEQAFELRIDLGLEVNVNSGTRFPHGHLLTEGIGPGTQICDYFFFLAIGLLLVRFGLGLVLPFFLIGFFGRAPGVGPPVRMSSALGASGTPR